MRRVVLPLVVLAALTLGVVGASGRTLATSTITVQVIGKGSVTGSSNSIKCGDGSMTCFLTFTNDATITLTQKAGKNWAFGSWSGDCVADPCDIDTSAPGDYLVFANFTPNSGATQSTLTVTYDAHNTSQDTCDTIADPGCVPTPIEDRGHVIGPEHSGAGSEIDCGSAGGGTGDCIWTELTGSTLTVFQEPEASAHFEGWGGACNGTTTSCTVQLGQDTSVNAGWADPTTPALTNTLSVSITGNGSVSGAGITCGGPGTCTADEPTGSSVKLTADADDGYVFSGWTGDCTGTGDNCTVVMSTDRDVTATFVAAPNQLAVTVNGNGAVSGGSGAINCGLGANICAANFAANASVTLVATVGTGATFLGWTGACGGTATTCTVSMNESKGVTANFSPVVSQPGSGFSLTVSVSGNGVVTGGGINCGNGATTCTSPNHAANSTVTLLATPTGGATFAGWSNGCTGTATTCVVTFNASKSVVATFAGGTSVVSLNVSVSGPGSVTGGAITCGNGQSTCSAQVVQGSTVTLTAKPATGAKFAGWGGSCSGTATTCSVSMTSARSVSATFTTTAAAGTLTINVGGKGTVSTSLGGCTAVGPSKTCVQHFKAGASATLTARPAAGQSFLGWSGACSGARSTCTVKLTAAQTVSANFSSKTIGGGGTATLSAIGTPLVRKTSTGWNVTLRFRTTVSGVATVRGLRAGRSAAALSLRVAAGTATIGPFPVKVGGFYTFEIRLAGRLLRERACLGTCGAKHTGDPFTLIREAPLVTKTGDVWSLTLHAVANQISDARIRAFRGTKLLVNQHFLGKATRISLGPFLLGPGNYTLRLTAVDPFGRTRTLTWIVSLGR